MDETEEKRLRYVSDHETELAYKPLQQKSSEKQLLGKGGVYDRVRKDGGHCRGTLACKRRYSRCDVAEKMQGK